MKTSGLDVYRFTERIMSVSSDRLVRMAARRARRACARLYAWIVREGAGGGGLLQGVAAPARVPVPAPVQAPDPVLMALAQASTPPSPAAPRVRLERRRLLSAGSREVSSSSRIGRAGGSQILG